MQAEARDTMRSQSRYEPRPWVSLVLVIVESKLCSGDCPPLRMQAPEPHPDLRVRISGEPRSPHPKHDLLGGTSVPSENHVKVLTTGAWIWLLLLQNKDLSENMKVKILQTPSLPKLYIFMYVCIYVYITAFYMHYNMQIYKRDSPPALQSPPHPPEGSTDSSHACCG